MADRLRPLVLLSLELCELRRYLRIAWCGDRPDDLDVDVYHRRAARRGTQRGNRASDRGRHDRRRRSADRRARGACCRYRRRGEKLSCESYEHKKKPMPPNPPALAFKASLIID